MFVLFDFNWNSTPHGNKKCAIALIKNPFLEKSISDDAEGSGVKLYEKWFQVGHFWRNKNDKNSWKFML